MPDKKQMNQDEKYDKFDLGNACSAGDCTGLIQTPPVTEEEEESYMDIYDYQPPYVMEHEEESKEKEKEKEKEKLF